MLRLVLVLALVFASAAAQLYQWTDKDGTIHFSNDPSKRPKERDGSVEEAKPPTPPQDRPKWERKVRETDEQKLRKSPAIGKE